MLAASDVPALLAHTRDVIFLEDGDLAEIPAKGARIETVAGKPVERPTPHHLVADAGRARRVQALHAQGDPRAAARHRGHPARPRLLEDGRRASPGDGHPVEDAKRREARLPRLRHSYHAALHGPVPDRASSRGCPRWSSWPASSATATRWSAKATWWSPCPSPARPPTPSPPQGGQGARRASSRWQRAGQRHRPRRPRRRSTPTRAPRSASPRTKCFTAQLAALTLLAIHLGRAAAPGRRARPRPALRRCADPRKMRMDLAQGAATRPSRGAARSSTPRRALPRARPLSPGRPGGRAQAQGDLVHPRRGLRRRRDEARPARAHRRAYARGVPAAERRRYEKMLSNLAGGARPRRQVIAIATVGDERWLKTSRRRPARAREVEALTPLLTVLPLQLLAYYVADLKRHRRRPAAQPRQDRHRRVLPPRFSSTPPRPERR
jgi:glucosamine--fructose-6-phosphate aminotransferase (isomerizing)